MTAIGTEGVTSQPFITIGSQVTVRDSFGEETFRIVGVEESDPSQGRISEASPMAMALLGHRSGDTVLVRAPYGTRNVTVLSVETTNGE